MTEPWKTAGASCGRGCHKRYEKEGCVWTDCPFARRHRQEQITKGLKARWAAITDPRAALEEVRDHGSWIGSDNDPDGLGDALMEMVGRCSGRDK